MVSKRQDRSDREEHKLELDALVQTLRKRIQGREASAEDFPLEHTCGRTLVRLSNLLDPDLRQMRETLSMTFPSDLYDVSIDMTFARGSTELQHIIIVVRMKRRD